MTKLVGLLAFFLVSCATVSANKIQTDTEDPRMRAAASALRLRLFCDGELVKYGSATAISPYVAITAKHVQCDDPAQFSSYEALTTAGVVIEMTKLQDAEGDVDARTLVSTTDQFAFYAPIALTGPSAFETVFGVTGDGSFDDGHPAFHWKAGTVSLVEPYKIYVSGHCVPGNSGSGWFNQRGELVGVLSAGVWDQRRENWCEGYRPSAWLALISP
jgi:hypothetical protein